MSHKNKKSLVRQVQERLDSMLFIGNSKHGEKIHGDISNKIFSWGTYKTYLKQGSFFVKYCREYHNCKTLDECRPYVDEWLNHNPDLSPYTIQTRRSTLSKIYQMSPEDFHLTVNSTRHRSDITRSRGSTQRDKHFSESNNSNLVEFCRSTGLRRRELSVLRGDRYVIEGDQMYIIVENGKGGRFRKVPVIGDQNRIRSLMDSSGKGRVFRNIPSCADIHGFRSDYATKFYLLCSRNIESLTKDEKYVCRGDRKGQIFDKKAMLQVSRALGHNRINVIASHYLHV